MCSGAWHCIPGNDMAQLLTAEIKNFIGVETGVIEFGEPVERGAVRRFAQAIMDPDPVYMDEDYTGKTRYRKPVAPPLFLVTMLRARFDAPDLVTENAHDPDFHGLIDASAMGLPPLPLGNSPQLNAGSEIEMFRLVCHGETVRMQSRYLDIHERETSKGHMLFVVIETDFTDVAGKLICRFRKTLLRR